ncbi:MAG TPA: CGNR zinc finger domain-containing protein [Catenuloplanes sp.]
MVDEGPLRLIREFVNTYDVEGGVEALTTPTDLTNWLRHQQLSDGSPADDTDLARAIELREAIRELLVANHDGEPDGPARRAASAVTAAARRVRLRPEFTPTTMVLTAATRQPVDQGLGAILAVIAMTMANGTWHRLKVCSSSTCRWAFFDASRSGAGRWCSMAVCGNRRKARAWRDRQRG